VSQEWLIWDLAGAAPRTEAKVFLWRCLAAPEGQFSVPALLEHNGDEVRARYLEVIRKLGELEINGESLRRRLQDNAGNNFWWMGLLAEKSPFKTPEIYQALRLLLLEKILRAASPPRLHLNTDERALVQAIGKMCCELGIPFSSSLLSPSGLARNLFAMFHRWPTLQGAISLVANLVRRWPLRQARPIQWQGGEKSIFMGSYFAHLDEAAVSMGAFHSRQWGPLPLLLTQKGLKLNWLQNFWPSDSAPDAFRGQLLSRRLNASSAGLGQHGFTDSYLGLPVLWKALRSMLWLRRQAKSLRDVPKRMEQAGLPAYLWPVFRPAWQSSLFGRVAMSNCLAIHLFDAALAELPYQPRGLYLFENQAWEKALLTAWLRHGHGRLIGVIHATVPFWHLYYAEHPVSVQGPVEGRMPLPDKLAVNGPSSCSALLAQGYDESLLIQVEALRYLDLIGQVGSSSADHRRVLVVGDMEPQGLRELLLRVRDASQQLGADWTFTFKPHPAYPISPKQLIGWDIPVLEGSLIDILPPFGCVIAGNSTSACLDAYLAGKPVMIAQSGASLNLSPLRGQSGVVFFESAYQLATALTAHQDVTEAEYSRSTYFHLDKDLPRWKALLGLSSASSETIQ